MRISKARRIYTSVLSSMFVSCLVLLVTFSVPQDSLAAEPKDVVLYHSNDLSLLKSYWSDAAHWCKVGGGSPAVKMHDIYVYYTVPDSERLGAGYRSFIEDRVIPAINEFCGTKTTVPYLIVTFHKLNKPLGPEELVDDLANHRTPYWDSMSFRVDDAGVTVARHELGQAAYHLSPEQMRALNPRNEQERREAARPKWIEEYELYRGDRFSVTSRFDSPGKAWCEHVYVVGLVEFVGPDETIDTLFEPDIESFLQANIIPKIQEICPTFPNAAALFTQSIRLEFQKAGEHKVIDSAGFVIGDDGEVAWSEGRQIGRPIAVVDAEVVDDGDLGLMVDELSSNIETSANAAFGQEFKDHPIVYQQDGLVVMTGSEASRLGSWCNSNTHYMYVFYDAPHAQRPDVLGNGIEAFARDAIYPRVAETCNNKPISKLMFMMYRSGQTGQAWDNLTVDVIEKGRQVVVSDYYPSPAASAAMTMEEIAAMMPKERRGFVERGELLFDDENIQIYAREKDWCTSRTMRPKNDGGIDVVFSGPYSELHSMLGREYRAQGNFAYTVILPLLNEQQCISRISAYFYEDGSLDYSERVTYGPDNDPFNPKFVVKARSSGQTVESQLAKIERERQRISAWGTPCNGAFCDLRGGAYLNAIFRNDAILIQALDVQAGRAVKGKLKGTGGMSDVILDIIERADQQESAGAFSLLPIIANRYFYNYQSGYALYCPNGLVRRRYEYQTDTYEEYDEGGLYAGTGGGENIDANYLVRPEFVSLCDRVCDHLGGGAERMLIENTGHEPTQMTMQGLDGMSDRYECDDPAVRQFEHNLVLLTEQSLRR